MMEVRPLQPEDDRQSFTSGDADLDRFFRKFAGQNQFRLHLGTTYVAVTGRDILGFVTLAATSITIDNLPARTRKRLPKYPLPALRIDRLAVAQSAQGQGIGKRLLRVAFQLAHEMAVEFYEGFGCERLEVISGRLSDHPSPCPLFPPLASIPAERKT